MIYRMVAIPLWLLPACAFATVRTATPLTFARALSASVPGDTLRLGAGNYGDTAITGKSGLTIVAPRNGSARFNTLKFNGSKRIHTSALVVQMRFQPGVTNRGSPVVLVNNSTDIELSDCRLRGAIALTGVSPTSATLDATGNVIGLATGYPIQIYRSDGVRVSRCDISLGYRNIFYVSSRNITIEDNDIHDARTSHVAGSVYEGLTIRQNHIWRSKPWGYGGSYDHGDAITAWTWKGSGQNARAVLIEDNCFEARDGEDILGIYMMAHDGTAHGFDNLQILRNVIVTNNEQGIRVERGLSGRIQDNQVFASMPLPRNRLKHPYLNIIGANGQTVSGNRINMAYWKAADGGWLGKVTAANRFGPTGVGEAEAAVKAWLKKFRP